MAKNKSKANTPPRQQLSDAEIKQALRFAKDRGLTKIDLRKPLNRYRIELASKYSEASKSPKLYTAVKVSSPKARTAFKQKGQVVGRDRVLVKKQATYETVRVRKDNSISISNKFYPEFNKVIEPGKALKPLKKGQKYALTFGTSIITFGSYKAIESFMLTFQQSSTYKGSENWEDDVEIVEDESEDETEE